MRFSAGKFAFLVFAGILPHLSLTAQSGPAGTPPNPSKTLTPGSTIGLRATSTINVASEAGGAFMSGSKCDADGNLYIRKFASDRPLLGPVVKIDPDGKRVALFDPAAFSQLALDRTDSFTPAVDGGLYQIAQSGVLHPRIYVLHFSSDGSPSSPTLLDADFEVYTFAAFVGGNFLVSGVKRDVQNKDDGGQTFTAVFSADGRELAQLSFRNAAPLQSANGDAKASTSTNIATNNKETKQKGIKTKVETPPPTLDLSDAEAGEDGNLYVIRRSSPALVYVISSSGTITKTLKIGEAKAASGSLSMPSSFHVSGNRLAIAFWNDQDKSQTVVVADAQTGRKIATYSDSSGLGPSFLGPSFACYSANEGVFTFLKLGEGNSLQVIHAEAQ